MVERKTKRKRKMVLGPPKKIDFLAYLPRKRLVFCCLRCFSDEQAHALDVSSDGMRGLSGDDDGRTCIWETQTGVPEVCPVCCLPVSLWGLEVTLKCIHTLSLQTLFEGHVGPIYTGRFLPSNEVVCTAGADFRLLLWRCADGWIGADMAGHTRGIVACDSLQLHVCVLLVIARVIARQLAQESRTWLSLDVGRTSSVCDLLPFPSFPVLKQAEPFLCFPRVISCSFIHGRISPVEFHLLSLHSFSVQNVVVRDPLTRMP